MNILENAPQRSAPWHAARAASYCASEAAAAMGLSKHTTRTALLRLKATGLAEEVDDAKRRLFDAGHASERAAMPFAEQIVGESLFPTVGTRIVDGLPLLASFDGITMAEDVSWENKLLNASLVAQIDAGDLEPHYWAQLEHQMLVSGSSKVLFTASDGTEAGTKHMWYVSVPDRRAQVLAAWHQFAADLATYTSPAATVVVTAAAMEHLPAVSVQMSGALTVASNLVPFGVALRAFVARMPAKPSTDQEFATAEAACKRLKAAEEALDAAEAGALASISDVELMRRMVADLRELSRTTRLASEKQVKARKEELRAEIVTKAQAALDAHLAGLNARLGSQWLPRTLGPFGEAIKGLKSLDSIQNAADTALANAKIAASSRADQVELNRKALLIEGKDWLFLFADFAQVGTGPEEVFSAVAAQRINKHKDENAAEAKRILDAAEAAKAQQAQVTPVQPPAAPAEVTVAKVAQGDLLGGSAAPEPATLGVDGVNIYFGLGITMTAEFIEHTLRVARGGEDAKRKTPTWRGSSLNAIAQALAAHALKAVRA